MIARQAQPLRTPQPTHALVRAHTAACASLCVRFCAFRVESALERFDCALLIVFLLRALFQSARVKFCTDIEGVLIVRTAFQRLLSRCVSVFTSESNESVKTERLNESSRRLGAPGLSQSLSNPKLIFQRRFDGNRKLLGVKREVLFPNCEMIRKKCVLVHGSVKPRSCRQ